jgi:putative ABC transport system permease protein
MVVSIDLSNASARRAFTLSTEAVAGRATHQVTGSTGNLDESIYRRIRIELGIRSSAPVLEGYARVPELNNTTMHLLGIDPFAEPPFRSYLAAPGSEEARPEPTFTLTPLLAEPSTVLIADRTAQQHGLHPGDTLTIHIGSKQREVRIVGLLYPHDTLSQQVLETMLICDIASAQELLDSVGKLSRIDLILEGEQAAAQAAEIRAILPGGAELTRPAARSHTLEQMTRAFSLNLSALSMLALIVGIFLIYNTMTFSVVQRREMIGTLRCIGVSRRQVFVLVLVEAALMSLVGSLIGVVLGILLARGLVQLVTRTINDLYFVVTVRSLAIDPSVLLKGFLIGVLATLAAAAIPAREATLVAPRMALHRSNIEERIRRAVPWTTAIGVVLLGVAGGLLLVPAEQNLIPVHHIQLAFAALFAILIGFALLTPGTTMVLMTLVRPLWGHLFGLPGRMAARGVITTLSRTSVAIAALMVAVSVTIGVGTMVGSFRQTVIRWLDQSLSADIYISSPSNTANRIDTTLDRSLINKLVQTPGVAGYTLLRGVQVQTPTGPTTLIAVDRDPRFGMRALRFKHGGTLESLAEQFDQGAVFISEPLAYRTGLAVGEQLELRTDHGLQTFPIAGIYYDYTSDRGVIQMAYPIYRTYWDDEAMTSCAMYVEQGVDPETLVRTLRSRVVGEQEVLIRSHRILRETTLDIFDRTFAITAVLQVLATIVAFIGILSALMALQLERTREIGMLRASGLTVRQLWNLLLSQTSLMGMTAGLLAIPVGMVLALVLIYVINRRSFGWTLQLVIDPWLFGQALLVAVVAAVLAGIYPALRMGRISPASALREE